MATEKQVEVKAETIVEQDTIADAPKKNAVAAETSPLKNEAEDLGAAVVKPTDSNPDATKKSKKVDDISDITMVKYKFIKIILENNLFE